MTELTKEYEQLLGMDEISRDREIVKFMVYEHVEPFTRETYIDLMGWDEIPDPWTAEHEGMLPPIFQDFDKVD